MISSSPGSIVIARCLHATGASLGAPRRGHLYTPKTVFHLKVGKEYTVLGIGLFESVLVALVCDETGDPDWFPVGVFDLAIQSVPPEWEFVVRDGHAASGGDVTNRWVAMWGYAELVRDPSHSDRLLEREPAALAVFYRQLEQASLKKE